MLNAKTDSCPRIDVSAFEEVSAEGIDGTFIVVIKSQDQKIRRERMIASMNKGRIGRIEKRPVSDGLFVRGRFRDGGFVEMQRRSFREPRHITPYGDGTYLLTEMRRILHVDGEGTVLRAYTCPYFSYLHSVTLSPDRKRALVASSGYDSLIEIDLQTGETTWHWFAWRNGFNPDADGAWLAATAEEKEAYEAEGKVAIHVDPAVYGEQGLLVARRSAHPNCAVYEDESAETILCSIGAHGDVYRIDRVTQSAKKISLGLSSMPHGLARYGAGWLITNTTAGEVWLTDEAFQPTAILDFRSLNGKVEGLDEREWLQQSISLPDQRLLVVDSNRAILHVDLARRTLSRFSINENYCVQDLLQV